LIFSTGGIARVPEIKRGDFHGTAFGLDQQAPDRRGTTGICVIDALNFQALDRFTGEPVPGPGLVITQVVTEIGTDYDQCFRTAPQDVDHLRNGLRRCVTNNQWHERKRPEHLLKKRQMHFETVLELVRGFKNPYLRHVQGGDCLFVQRHITQRRAERVGATQRQVPDGDAVTGPQQDHASVLITVRA